MENWFSWELFKHPFSTATNENPDKNLLLFFLVFVSSKWPLRQRFNFKHLMWEVNLQIPWRGRREVKNRLGQAAAEATVETGSECQAENPRTQEADHLQVMPPEGWGHLSAATDGRGTHRMGNWTPWHRRQWAREVSRQSQWVLVVGSWPGATVAVVRVTTHGPPAPATSYISTHSMCWYLFSTLKDFMILPLFSESPHFRRMCAHSWVSLIPTFRSAFSIKPRASL